MKPHFLSRFIFAVLILGGLIFNVSQGYSREFRGMWIATVYNIDWPSRPGLSEAQQKAELIAALDLAKRTGLNAVLLQVRPASDALYSSRREPWSHVLTGTMGRSPGYDPLEFAIREARARGLQLHAWINPFRAVAGSTTLASNHIANRRPEWIRRVGTVRWLDPGIPEARQYVLDTIIDIAQRYPVDGIHIDDYFYPYPTTSRGRKTLPNFGDDGVYQAYQRGGGELSKTAWRRDNINRFVEAMYRGVKRARPRAQVGISPFGIWRPGIPTGTTAGVDAYEDLAADARYWLQQGWCDYMAPQLYWGIEPQAQSFPLLMEWWVQEGRRRNIPIWPGLGTERVGSNRPASEIVRQIEITRRMGGNRPGHIHWHYKALKENRGGVTEMLRRQSYR
ncbi:MAG: glycoside hydrolase family 10 protein [Verrucomicrobiales bacterium]